MIQKKFVSNNILKNLSYKHADEEFRNKVW